ncbi:Surface antigen [Tistlia consotensis]|uniref:Surface antigen n=1 Tax=Tistlia consotensis USBA 355 TaxID=560819 RepID=A0A1Y6CK99_9PROT|nr:RT0821/Lpp0805 family surface protein [Tistlia consotensis]SMF72407.1 Surface antigen [Tistlia consotensis USBA 355]SNS09068.1 Surface antigen [Tistlia consotensis]
MTTRPARTAVALALVASLGALPLAGCQSVESETGMSKNSQTGALGGAAAGGIIAAIAGANPAWIAASTILGGVSGGLLGDYLGKSDAEKHAQTNLNALDTLGAGQSSSWSDPSTGNGGSTTVHRVFTANGRTCKTYTETVRTAQKSVSQDATACRQSDGTWQVQRV